MSSSDQESISRRSFPGHAESQLTVSSSGGHHNNGPSCATSSSSSSVGKGVVGVPMVVNATSSSTAATTTTVLATSSSANNNNNNSSIKKHNLGYRLRRLLFPQLRSTTGTTLSKHKASKDVESSENQVSGCVCGQVKLHHLRFQTFRFSLCLNRLLLHLSSSSSSFPCRTFSSTVRHCTQTLRATLSTRHRASTATTTTITTTAAATTTTTTTTAPPRAAPSGDGRTLAISRNRRRRCPSIRRCRTPSPARPPSLVHPTPPTRRPLQR